MRHARADYNRFQDPLNKIPGDEPVFLLRAQNKHAAKAVAYYAMRLSQDPDADPEMASVCLRWSQEMSKWPKNKIPDM